MSDKKRLKNIQSLVEEFLVDIDASAATSKTYKNAIKQFCMFVGNISAKQLTPSHVINFREYLKSEGRRPATIQLYLVGIRRFFSWGSRKYKDMISNITDGIKGVKPGNTFVRSWLTEEKAKTLLDSVHKDTSLKGKRDYAMIALMLTTGLRCIEVSRANMADISKRDYGTVLFIQGKGHDAKDAYVKLTEKVVAALEGYFKARNEYDAKGSLFASLSRRRKGRMTTRSIGRIVKDRLREAGLDDPMLCAHSLRHTTATLNLLNGGTLEETKQLLRHRSMDTTLRYSHALDRAKNQSEARISDALFE